MSGGGPMTPRDMDDEQLTAAWHRLCDDWAQAPVGSGRRVVVGRVLDDLLDEVGRRGTGTTAS